MSTEQQTTTKPFLPQQKRFKLPTPPSYGVLANSESNLFPCDICLNTHATNDICQSKPPYPPDQYFKKCRICLGHHPNGRCYFQNLKESLDTISPCQRCNGLNHHGFCFSELFCIKCNQRHNTTDECTYRTTEDLSKNLCPNCNSYHTNHCYKDLLLIETGLILWCNRCKVEHAFLKCVPFCDKCQRRHRPQPNCPDPHDYCNICEYSHHGKLCPKSEDIPGKPRIIPNCAPDCNGCCKAVHYKERRRRKPSPHPHLYELIIDDTQQLEISQKNPTQTKFRPHRELLNYFKRDQQQQPAADKDLIPTTDSERNLQTR